MKPIFRTATIFLLAMTTPVMAGSEFTARGADSANTGDVGELEATLKRFIRYTREESLLPTDGAVTTTPIVAGGHVVVGDETGQVYFFDPANGTETGRIDLGATVTAILSANVGAAARAYASAGDGSLHCLEVPSGTACTGFPVADVAGGPALTVISESGLLLTGAVADGCSAGGLYTIDLETGESVQVFSDGTVAMKPAIKEFPDGSSLVYAATEPCTTGTPADLTASLIALDPSDWSIAWTHKRRLVDPVGLRITSVLVADVSEFGKACNVVVSTDEDGCVYGYPQRPTIPQPGAVNIDPLRVGQQQLNFSKCVVQGGAGSGFAPAQPALSQEYVFAQAIGENAPGDDVNTFSFDVCYGQVEWVSSDIGKGAWDTLVGSRRVFNIQLAPDGETTEVQVVPATTTQAFFPSPDVQATISIPHPPPPSGTGVAIADRYLLVPTADGVSVVTAGDPYAGEPITSPPTGNGTNSFNGPYVLPLAPSFSPLAPFNRTYPQTILPFPVDKFLEEAGLYQS